MIVFIFLLLFFGSGLTKRIDYQEITSDDQNAECNFADYNKDEPNIFPLISAPNPRGCGGSKLSLRKIHTSVSIPELYGTENIVDLLYSRIGKFDIDWSSSDEVATILDGAICQNHFKELVAEWETRKSKHTNVNKKQQSLCLYYQIFFPDENKKCLNIVRFKTTKEDTTKFKNEYSTVIQPGAGFCIEHYNIIKRQITGKTEAEDSVCTEFDEESVEEKSEAGVTDDETCDPNFESPVIHDEKKIETVRQLGKQLGVTRLITEDNYNDLGDREKRHKIRGGSVVVKFLFSVLGPNSEEEIGSKICSEFTQYMKKSNRPEDELKKVLAHQYVKATDKKLKKIVLAPLAKTCSYAEIVKYIPGLSYYFYNQAKKCDEIIEIPKDLPKVFHRYDENNILTFMGFFTSPHCMVILPYGSLTVKLSNGVKIDVADNIRLQSHNQIINMFEKKMKEEGRESEILPRSTMFSILHHCHAKKSKEQTCVDYFLAAAVDGFDELRVILDYWAEIEAVTLQESTELKLNLTNGQNYLKTDFSINLKQESSVISHCFKYALSDPIAAAFTAQCSEHLTVCARCESLNKVLDDIKKLSAELISDCKKNDCEELVALEIKQIQIDYAIFNILELKSHIVRSRWSDMERARDISELDEHKAYVTFDWAQKQLPMKFRETQKDYFGKNGMAHHITHVQTIVDNAPAEQSFVHIIENNKQDSQAVLAILLDVLMNLKADGIKSVILRSDNAGCYHSKEMMLSLEEVSRRSGVQITKYSFSEPQDGKGNCDRIAALVKNQIRKYVRASKVDAVHNVCDEKQMFEALKAYPGIPNSTISISTVTRTEVNIPSTALKGISSYYVFTFQAQGIQVHRAANIGEGKLFRYNSKNHKKNMNIPTLLKSNDHRYFTEGNTNIWNVHRRRQRKETSENENPLFYCTDEDCMETFTTFENLTIHLLEGKHTPHIPEKDLMQDFVIRTYQEKVKQLNPNTDLLTQAIANEKERTIDESSVPEMGWAHRNTKTSPIITEKAREFVREKFNEGAKQKASKWTPKQIAKAMAAAKKEGNHVFEPREILFPEQIQQMLSKFAAEQKKTNSYKPPEKKRKTAAEKKKSCDLRLNNLEEEVDDDDDDDEKCTDETTQSNRYINQASRALRHQNEMEIDDMYENVDQNMVETDS